MKILCRPLKRDHRLAVVAILGAGSLLACSAPLGHAQEQPRKVKPSRAAKTQASNPPVAVRQNPGNRKVENRTDNRAVDPTVWPLLNKMFRPQVNYTATEVSTFVANGMSSEDQIQGDTAGRTRRDYLSPGQLKGNIILTSPNQFYNYKHQEDRLYIAQWPMELVDKAVRLREMVRAGRVRIQLTGETMVAGRAAKQITIWAAGGNGALEGNEARRVLDLDTETGILLQATRYDSTGHLISSTALRNVNLGMNLDPNQFDPKSLPAAKARVPIFPDGQPMFATVEQAHIPFTIKQPTQLPAGYTLDGVWVFGLNTKRPSVLLRYSSGVSHFSLFERLVPQSPTGAAPLLRPNDMKPRRTLGGWAWRLLVPEGELNMLFTGYLPESQQKALWSALE